MQTTAGARMRVTAAVTRLSPAADGTSDRVSSTSGGVADGVARAKSEVVPVVGGARHVEAAGAADGIDDLVHLAAGTALVEDGDSLSDTLACAHGLCWFR